MRRRLRSRWKRKQWNLSADERTAVWTLWLKQWLSLAFPCSASVLGRCSCVSFEIMPGGLTSQDSSYSFTRRLYSNCSNARDLRHRSINACTLKLVGLPTRKTGGQELCTQAELHNLLKSRNLDKCVARLLRPENCDSQAVSFLC